MAGHRYETVSNVGPSRGTTPATWVGSRLTQALAVLAEIASVAARHGIGRTHGSAERGRSWAAKRAEDALIVLAGIGLALPLIVLGA